MTTSPTPAPKARWAVHQQMCIVVLVLLISSLIPMANANVDISRNRTEATPLKGQDGNEKKTTMAEIFHQHNQQITTQRRMRARSLKTKSNANSNGQSVGSKRRGGVGTGVRNKRGSGNKKANGNKNNRANNKVGNGVLRNKNQNLGGGNAKRTERNGTKRTRTGRREGKTGSATKNGVRGGNNMKVNRGNTGKEKKNKTGGEISTRSREKAQESMASAVVKKGIILVPIRTPATDKAKSGKRS